MNTQAIVKTDNSIKAEDKHALYMSVPFESAIYDDLSAYDALFAEYVHAQRQGVIDALQRTTSTLKAMNRISDIDKVVNSTLDMQLKARAFIDRVSVRLVHVADKRFNIVYACKKERSNARTNKTADNSIDLKAYALFVHSEVNIKAAV